MNEARKISTQRLCRQARKRAGNDKRGKAKRQGRKGRGKEERGREREREDGGELAKTRMGCKCGSESLFDGRRFGGRSSLIVCVCV
jgi:hypothetical protein